MSIAVIPPGGTFSIPPNSHIHLQRISIIDDCPDLSGRRLTLIAHVTSPTEDGRTVQMDVALASFILGQDYDQSTDIMFAPVDQCVITTIGPEVAVQLLYSKSDS
jgi:hypothetical protein